VGIIVQDASVKAFVWVLEGRRNTTECSYIIAIFQTAEHAEENKARWLRWNPEGVASVTRYTNLNGHEPSNDR
jgi:post-segregation antitoxin (ccd killing protein)